ncbi:hypothetical protein ScPMuIL_012330 [Solemya velum]
MDCTVADSDAPIDLLYPELLTREGLLHILSQRYIRNEDVENLDKEELLELYYKFIIPLPQRKYRNNRRGQAMTKKQLTLDRKRKLLLACDSETPTKKARSSFETGLSSFSLGGPVGDRLKPPPSPQSQKKLIKIGATTGSNGKKDTAATVVTCINPRIKKISLSSSPSKNSVSPSKNSVSEEAESATKTTISLIKKIKYDSDVPKTIPEKKIDAKISENNQVGSNTNTEEKSDVKKGFKVKPVSWP